MSWSFEDLLSGNSHSYHKMKPTRKDHNIPNRNKDTDTMSILLRSSAANADAASEISDETPSSGASKGKHQADGMDTTQKDHVKEVEEMAKRETRNMRTWKCVVTLAVLVTATLVSAGTYIFLASDADSNFEDSYYSFANTIGDAAEVQKRNLFSAMRGCSNSISAASITTNSTFPFVTVPAFEVLAESVRQQSESELLLFTPKVEVGEVTRWNRHATANEGWYEESKQLAVSSSEGALVQSDFAPGGPLPFIYETILDENGNPTAVPVMPVVNDPPFYPLWQVSPPPFSPIIIKANIGGVSQFSSGSKAAEVAGEGVLGPTMFSDLYGLAGVASKEEDHEAFHAQFMVSSETESAYDRPHVFFFQPIFREIYNNTSEVVGYISALIPCDSFFSNLLPEGVKGIACVASNTCGQSFTYYLDGNSVSCSQLKVK
jgi:hypothetical protein